MCDSWKLQSPDELSLDEIAAIFNQLPALDAVRLTGGEPFVRRDLGKIADLVRAYLKPLVLHVTTNGFLTDRIVRFCEARDHTTPLYLLVSVDGMAAKHNQVRGLESAWDRTWATLRALAPRQRELRLNLAVNQTIVDAEGVEQYLRLREFLRPHGVRVHTVMAYDQSATYHEKREVDVAPAEIGEFTTFGTFTRADLETLLREAERDLNQFPLWERWARRYYLRGIRQRLLAGQGRPNPACVALNAHLRLFPNGDVPTCQFNSRIVGNLRQQSFAEVWQGATIESQRAWVRRCPGCWAECEVLPSAIYTLDVAQDLFRRDAPSKRALGADAPLATAGAARKLPQLLGTAAPPTVARERELVPLSLPLAD
jgi:MoaA/NifB/PqqE/SkfB family radical SAM enzyme